RRHTRFSRDWSSDVCSSDLLSRSLNSGAVWLLREIGVTAGVEMAERLGISTLTPDDRHLGLALGGLKYGTTPLEMAAAYLPFAKIGRASCRERVARRVVPCS